MSTVLEIGIGIILGALIIALFKKKSPSNEIVEKLSLSYLKSFRKQKNSAIIVANLASMQSKIKDENIMKSFMKYVKENPQALIVAEYSEKEEAVVKYIFAKNCDDDIYSLVSANGGCVVITD